MSRESLHKAATAAIVKFEKGETSYAVLVNSLEDILDSAFARHDPVAPELDPIWVHLEIMNATNEDGDLSAADQREVHSSLDRFVGILASGE